MAANFLLERSVSEDFWYSGESQSICCCLPCPRSGSSDAPTPTKNATATRRKALSIVLFRGRATSSARRELSRLVLVGRERESRSRRSFLEDERTGGRKMISIVLQEVLPILSETFLFFRRHVTRKKKRLFVSLPIFPPLFSLEEGAFRFTPSVYRLSRHVVRPTD